MDDHVGADELVDRSVCRRRGGGTQGAEGGDQRESDHQRGGRRRRASPVPLCVLHRQHPGGTEQATDRPAEHADHRSADRGGQDRHAHEHEEGAQPHQAGGLPGPADARQPEGQTDRAECAEHGADQEAPAQGARGQRHVVAHRRHRRDLGRPPARGTTPTATVTSDADDVGQDDRARQHDERPGLEVDAQCLEEALEPQGEQHAEGESQRPADDAGRQGLEHDGARDLPPTRPERAQQRQLAGALGDQHRERVEDDERADEQGDACEHQQEDVDELEALLDVGRILGQRPPCRSAP